MNLYDLHPDPKNAPGYATRYDDIPELIWERYRGQAAAVKWPSELRKREKALARSAKYAYLYAAHVLKGPFPAGEAVIAKDPEYAYYYAVNCLGGPFLAGEAAMASHSGYAYYYARWILNARFPAGEAAIIKDESLARVYAKNVLRLSYEEACTWGQG